MNKKLAVAAFLALSTVAATVTFAAPQGSWACYVGDRFPDVEAARKWKGSRKVEDGMNQVAPNTPPGTVITINMPMKGASMGAQVAAPVICVKN